MFDIVQVVVEPSEIRYEKIVSFALAGAVYNFAAYGNTFTKTGESWDPYQASRTLMLGLFAGGIVAFTNPDEGLTPANFETAMYLAIPVLDQLIGGYGHLKRQIETNQFPDWGEGWFYDGTSPGPSEGSQTDADSPGLDPDQYFDAVSPDEGEDASDIYDRGE